VANKGIKMQIARQLDAGDEYVELERDGPHSQWEKIKEDYKDGFDVVVTCSKFSFFGISKHLS
jgi:D-arabinitol dehydrogenase (NADP+)